MGGSIVSGHQRRTSAECFAAKSDLSIALLLKTDNLYTAMLLTVASVRDIPRAVCTPLRQRWEITSAHVHMLGTYTTMHCGCEERVVFPMTSVLSIGVPKLISFTFGEIRSTYFCCPSMQMLIKGLTVQEREELLLSKSTYGIYFDAEYFCGFSP